MENVVNLTRDQVVILMERLSYADVTGKSARICTGRDAHGTWVKWDIGQTGWTPPLYGTL